MIQPSSHQAVVMKSRKRGGRTHGIQQITANHSSDMSRRFPTGNSAGKTVHGRSWVTRTLHGLVEAVLDNLTRPQGSCGLVAVGSVFKSFPTDNTGLVSQTSLSLPCHLCGFNNEQVHHVSNLKTMCPVEIRAKTLQGPTFWCVTSLHFCVG